MNEAGRNLLHYRLVEKIGQGGMGSVWRARDTTLDREAAIKILPDALADDPQFLARFEREAKLLASLSHPNLAAVFGVHEVDGTRFLAMELVPGEDLSHRLERGPLAVDEALGILGPIADALQAAHERGVIHRDLKPANVRLTPDGRVKVLDFGLAKALRTDPAIGHEADPRLTSTGLVLGTAPYMSPEQARGHAVDTRTDVWSFGCVLWECLAGEKPFRGETVSDQIASILSDEPDWTKLPAGTPSPIVRLLRRCLAKSPRERLHHVADARLELEEAAGALASGDLVVPEGAGREPGWHRFAAVLLAVAWAATLGALLVVLRRDPDAPALREGVLAGATFTKLTDFPGEEIDAVISADGREVAFLSDRDGPFNAYVGRIGTFEYLNVSRGAGIRSPKFPPAKGVRRVGFRGDGGGVWLGGGADQRLRLISLPAGQSKSWLPTDTIHADWSPDGRRLVYSLGTGGDPIFVADANGANFEPVPLPSEEGFHQHFPTWSPDSRWIYLVRGRVVTGNMSLWRVHPDGSGLEQLTFTTDVRNVVYPAPLDARTVLFVAEEPDGSGPWLWELDVDTKAPRRVTLGVERYASVSASRNGRRLVATVANPQVGLWTVPIRSEAEGVATEDDVEPHPLRSVRALAPRIRGDDLFYLSSIGGGDGLWRYRDGRSEEVWNGSDPLLEPVAISPDGTHLAIVLRRELRARLYVVNADGTSQPLLNDVEVIGAACWSPNGEWIAVGGLRDGRRGLFKVRVSDGETKRIQSVEAMDPVWSPDGGTIVYAGAQVGPEMQLRAVDPEGRPLDFPPIRVPAFGERARFLSDGSGLVYLQGFDPDYELRLLDLETGRSRPLTKFADSSTMRTFDITADGKTIVFDRLRANSDLVLIERR